MTKIHLALVRMCDIGMLERMCDIGMLERMCDIGMVLCASPSSTLHASEEQKLARAHPHARSLSLTMLGNNVAGGRARTPKGAWLSLRPRCRYSDDVALRTRERGYGAPCSSQALAGVSLVFRM